MTEEILNREGKKRCECGKCDEWIPLLTKEGKPARFKHYHHRRGKSILRGSDNPAWNGGRFLTPKGYVMIYVPDHPHTTSHHHHIYEHRWIMEQHLGRYLERSEHVHHINGIKDDNRIENLQLLTGAQHNMITHTKDMSSRKCVQCGKNNSYRRQWYRYEKTGLFICHDCYDRNLKERSKHKS